MPGAQPVEVQKIQAVWLRDWHRYMVNSYAMDCFDSLEVGCGSGCVMRNLEDLVKVKGVDIDDEQVNLALDRGLTVEKGNAIDLKFPDGSFDLVYSSFFLMWVDRPEAVLDEMVRVARRKVMFLSEPIWGKAVLSPPSLGKLVDAEMDVIASEGGDPDAGLNLIKLLKRKGMKFRFGTVPMDTSPDEVSRWVKVEQEYLRSKGRKVAVKDVEIFHVPFIWAALDLSG